MASHMQNVELMEHPAFLCGETTMEYHAGLSATETSNAGWFLPCKKDVASSGDP